MNTLGSQVFKIRSKNAGPFWVTIDVFCGSEESYNTLCSALSTEQVAKLLAQPVENVKRFNIASLQVIKFSLPRPCVQGSRQDRDMHGAQWAVLLSEMQLNNLN